MKYILVVLCVVAFTANTVDGQRSRAISRHLSHRRERPRDEAVWTTWSRWTPCSFTCDRGVRSRYRGCVQRTQRGLVRQADSKCHGKPREYQMCEEQPCPMGSATPKEYQCAQKNKVKVLDKQYEWTPLYVGSNRCALTCMASGHAFYNNFGHASDGTPCGTKHTLRRSPVGDEVERVCINGTCLAVGCDGMVDSGTRLDKCRVCGGENANCYHFRNSYMILEAPEEDHEQYQDMVVIPEGATYVEVTDHSDNYLALADDKGTFILNGNWMIDWPGKYEVDNTVINYERRGRAEILTIEGPTTRKLILKLLFRERNPGVHYEFYIPSPKIDEILVPEPHFKNKKSPTFIPPPLRPPRYGTGTGNVVNEVEEKVNEVDGASVARTTVRPTPKPKNKGVEIPLARILDDEGYLVEAKLENTTPEHDEAPPSADQVNDGIPWYLKAQRSEEFDDLVGGGIPLVRPNRPSASLGGRMSQYGSPPYHRPTANNGYSYALYGLQLPGQGYANPYAPFAGDGRAARLTDAVGLLSPDAGFVLRNQYNPPPGGGPMTVNWDQFSSFPYSRPLPNAINPRADPSADRRIRNGLLNGEVLTAGGLPMINGTIRNLAALYPGNRNPAVPPQIADPEYRISLLRPQMPRVSRPGHSRSRAGGVRVPDAMNPGLNTARRPSSRPAGNVRPDLPPSAPTPHPERIKLTNGNRRNEISSPGRRPTVVNDVNARSRDQQRERLHTSGRVTRPEVNANQRLPLYDVARNSEPGFIRPPQPAPVPPAYRNPDETPKVDRTRNDAASGELPLGADLPKIGARGYVLGDRRMSYLDYYKDKRNARQALESFSRLTAPPGGAYYGDRRNNRRVEEVMALDSGIPVADSGIGTDALQAYDVPDLDKSIGRTLEITPEGERVILYDLTDVFKDADPEDNQVEPFDPGDTLGPVVADDKYITDAVDDVTDGTDVVENVNDNDEVDNDSDVVVDADADDDDSKSYNAKPENPETGDKNLIDKKRDLEIFDYINEIIENGNGDSSHAVNDHRPTTADGQVLESVTMTTPQAEISTASGRVLTPERSTSVTTTGPATSTGTTLAAGVRLSTGSDRIRSKTCPKCVRSRDLIKSYCSSDIVARVTAHSSRIVGGQTRYKVTIGEVYKQTLDPRDAQFVWVNNTCRCPRLRKNTDYLLMGKYANGRFTLDHESYAKKYKPSLKRKLHKITTDCPVW